MGLGVGIDVGVGLHLALAFHREPPRETEVEDLEPSVRGQVEVPGLEIAVDHPLGMRGCQSFGELDTDVHHFGLGQRAALAHDIVEALAGLHLHHDAVALGRGDVVVKDGDVRMLHPREGARFRTQLLPRRLAGKRRGGEQLDRALLLELVVDAAIHHTHCAMSDLLDDRVRTDRAADHGVLGVGRQHGYQTASRPNRNAAPG